MPRSAATGIIFILAGLWTAWTLLVAGIAVFYQFIGIDSPDTQAASMLYMCSSVNFIILVILIAGWHTKKNKEDKMDDLASYLRLYRRTHISKVAERMNLDTKATEKLMLECISKKFISGYLDRSTGEFILKESITEMKTGTKCPNCGGYSTDVSFPGEIVRCQFCNAVISGEELPPPPPPNVPPVPRQGGGGRIMLCSGCRKEIPLDSNLCPYCGNNFNQ